MPNMLLAALVINVSILLPVTFGLLTERPWAVEAYGAHHGGRQILLAVYIAILLVSVALLVLREPKMVVALLAVQVVYKVLTPWTVGELTHPVVLSNLAIAGFHTVAIGTWYASRS